MAAVTALVATGISFFRLFWYMYELGYYSALGVDNIHVTIDDQSSFYSFIGQLGMVILILLINYIVYQCIINKRPKVLLLLCVYEVIGVLVIAGITGNISWINVIAEIIQYKLFKETINLLLMILVGCVVINIYGIIFGLLELHERKKKRKTSPKKDGKIDVDTIKIWIITILSCALILGGFLYYVGRAEGNKKIDYKVIVERIEEGEYVSNEEYIFEKNGEQYRIFIILYEGKENYVIADVSNNVYGITIEFDSQNIISKVGVKTKYFENFYDGISQEFDCIETNEKNGETEIVIKENEEGETGMLDNITDIATIVVALVSLFISVRAVKLQQMGIVFENRLNVYLEVENIYSKCKQMVKLCSKSKGAFAKKNMIQICMYGINAEESMILGEAFKYEREMEKADCIERKNEIENEWHKLVERYADVYIEKYIDIVSKIKLFYDEDVADYFEKVNNIFDDLQLGVIICDEDEIDERIKKLEVALGEFEDKNIIYEMKKKLPIK